MTTIMVDSKRISLDELSEMLESNVYPPYILAHRGNYEITFTYQHKDMYSMSAVIYPENAALPRANACVCIYSKDIIKEISNM